MRIGAPVFGAGENAHDYVCKLKTKNYRAAYCPDYLKSSEQVREIDELKSTLAENDIVLAEVGAWCNPLSRDVEIAQRAKEYLIDRLKLAEALNATCCVNVMGSASSAFWYAPAAENFTETFRQQCVALYREVIDAVCPVHTRFVFEVMPFCFLDSTDEYFNFISMLDRPAAGVHLDLVNLIHDPRTLYNHREIFDDAVKRLGAQCVSAHIKDITIENVPPNTRLNEVLLGQGEVDLAYMIRCLDQVPGDLPVMLEHLPDEAAYDAATRCFVQTAKDVGVALQGGFE